MKIAIQIEEGEDQQDAQSIAAMIQKMVRVGDIGVSPNVTVSKSTVVATGGTKPAKS